MKKEKKIWNRKIVTSTVVTVLLSIIYYLLFSWLFDTPIEYELKKSTDRLKEHITELQLRCDTIETVLRNLEQRDSAVFGLIFESTPYVAEDKLSDRNEYDDKSIAELSNVLLGNISELEQKVNQQNQILDSLFISFAANPSKINSIPSIQPINNPNLRSLATSYGLRINPFDKKRTPHKGFDYAVPVGTAVFATADGVVSKIEKTGSTTGTSVTINHGNEYETFYACLSRVSVRVGTKIRRGDIIAFTGDNGLSYAPHLHYEVRKNGVSVNPIDYMFLEIGPDKIEKFREIASHAMQAFD